jgi:predicted esterase
MMSWQLHSRVTLFGLMWGVLAAWLAGTSSAETPIDALKRWLAAERSARPALAEQSFAAAALSGPDAKQTRRSLWEDHCNFIRAERQAEWKEQVIHADGAILALKERRFGAKPKNGWRLFISMHGGGSAPKELNDSQWENQIKLYQPPDSLYIAPRAPTNGWNLWHEPHIDPLFARLIEDAIVLGEVDPNHIYIMGYSAGGDGVYQLAPRMADRWAAAAMMAGHPNDASPLGLRDIGFTIHVGALDDGYGRNKVAAEWKQKLDALQQADPGGYAHEVKLHEGRGHWMHLEDRVAIDWMLKFTRNPTPAKVVWKQSSVTHEQFYWLAVPHGEARAGTLVIASRNGQTITIEKAEGLKQLNILLNDQMADLDKPIRVMKDGRELFNGIPMRTIAAEYQSLEYRGDPDLIFDAMIAVQLGSD